MFWVFVVVVVLAMGGIALVASGRGAPMVDDYDDRPDALVPASGALGADDLRRVRFSLGFRGYRMSEVDALLSRLAAQLDADHAWRPSADEPVVEAPGAPDAEGDDAPVTLAKHADPPPVDAVPGRHQDVVPPG